MLIQLLVVACIGALVGYVLGRLATRRGKQQLVYMAAGVLGAVFWAALPLLRGQGYLNMYYRDIAIVAAAFAGLAILFGSARRR